MPLIRSERAAAAASMTGAVSNQLGAAIGATIFPLVGPVGVVAARQFVSAIVLLGISRPRLHRLTWRQLRPALLLGAALVSMNVSIYFAIERIGLGLAVTLEFLGPLALALISSRRRRDLGIAALAGLGVVLLTGTVSGLDPLGIAFALLAAASWAGYILCNQVAGRSLPGLQGTAIGSLVATITTLPLLVVAVLHVPEGELPRVLLVFLAAGLLASVVPYSIDLVVLRHLRREVFGILQSIHPAAAALAGLLVLQQLLTPLQWAGLLLVSAGNVLAVLLGARGGGPASDPGVPEADPRG
ncbi:EamA family transporter [Homoserinibacter sp. YIM 151385]|uniref:EamA family transporter n=1 Tax=Homoserinibacter sp. YIM 151385 TaxID=2985506 RepID=UPI0022EFF4EB|nr:EamA family transporter [Homoserinibacter sp. YIM 151385]WBU38614.1 EamA family transporter [Homoserinibacter sp. YIM 151385]